MPALKSGKQAIDAVKRFGDAIEGEKELKNNPTFDGLRSLLNEPLAFFKDLRRAFSPTATPHPNRWPGWATPASSWAN